MPQTKIVFFDLPTNLGVPTSPYTWRVRLVLNYKGLEHETRWIPTIDIETTCISLGIAPTGTKPSGAPHYTLPAIIDSTLSDSEPVILSDSTPIIQYLERQYPSPSPLFPSSVETIRQSFDHLLSMKIMAFGASLWLMELYNSKLPQDRDDFRGRMEVKLGMTLEDARIHGTEREHAWKELEQKFDQLLDLCEKGGTGTEFLMGQAMTYPDIAVGACLIFLKNTSPEEAWGKVVTWSGGRWLRLLKALEPWMSVTDC